MLEIRDLVKRFGAFSAVDGVSLSIEAGEFFTLLGPSGCGKTTLLRLIGGFEQPDAGTIVLDGQDLAAVPPERRPLHTVFQNYALFPHLSVARNVAFALEMQRRPRDEIRRRVAQALDEVQLADHAHHRPHELSGGQRQRVAIARALIDRPRLLLLDEPLGALDAKLREQMKLELITLQRELGLGFVYVTHDQAEALALSTRIAVMNHGRVEQLGDPHAIYERPANRFVADFIGRCNLLPATVQACAGARATLEVAGLGRCDVAAGPGLAPGQRGLLALRPEALRLAPRPTDAASGLTGPDAPAGLQRTRGRLLETLFQGDVSVHSVACDGGAVLRAMQANADPTAPPPAGAGHPVVLEWPAAAAHFLPG